MIRLLSLAGALLPVGLSAVAFDPEAGLPAVRNFPPEAYRGHSQIFATTRTADGTMYFGTYGALVSFDGERWRQYPLPGAWTRALAVGRDGLVYIGGGAMLGRLEPDPRSGELRFSSLAALIPEAQRSFNSVWSIAVAGDTVLFAIDGAVLGLRTGAFQVWPFPGERPALRTAGDDVFCHVGEQLLRWTGEWTPFAHDPRLAAVRRLTVLPADGGEPVIALENGALLRAARDGALREWPTSAASFLQRSGIRNGLRLNDGSYALSTAGHGLVFLGADGTPLRRLGPNSGLAHNATYGLGLGAEGLLWVETANGLSALDPSANWSVFDARNGRPDTIGGETWRFHGDLWLTMGDVAPLRLTPAPDAFSAARLEPMADTASVRFSNTLSLHGAWLGGGERGLMRVDGGLRVLHATSSQVEDVLDLKSLPGVVVAGLLRGAEIIRVGPDLSASLIARVPDFDLEATIVVEAPGREVWIGTTAGVALRLRLNADGTIASTTRFDAQRGLPATAAWVKLHATRDGPLVIVREGVFRLDPTGEKLTPDPRFAAHSPAGLNTLPFESDGAGRFWFQQRRANGNFQLGCLDTRSGAEPQWTPVAPGIDSTLGFGGARVLTFLPEGGREYLWISGTHSTVRLELSAPAVPTSAPTAVISEIMQGAQRWRPRAAVLRVPFSREPIRFLFASPTATLNAISYETRLLGYAENWTPATSPEASYTNLIGGPFTLEVRAHDALGRAGPIARAIFSVSPPWHRSTVAFAGYVLGTLGAIFGFVRWRLGRAEREQRRLTALVATRTTELAAARDQAESANRAKSAFLAAMSHELRTPLNGVIGYAQILQSDPRLAPDQQERVRIVQHSGEHLLRMINDVLDLAKIEAGKIDLRPAPFRLEGLLRDIAASHAPAAQKKGLGFSLAIAPDLPAAMTGDAQKLRQVLENLIGNAIKFTASGSVSLQVSRPQAPLPAPGDGVQFSVRDSGSGISAEDQMRLFQPFEQAAARGDTPGTGLGLAISRALVTGMGGAIDLTSEVGRGSEFTFSIPLPAAAMPASSGAALPSGYAGTRRRILVVDDHTINRRLIVDLLTPLGFACAERSSSTETIQRLAAGDEPWPDLFVLDVRMTGRDGLDMTRAIRALPQGRAAKILLMSASVLGFDQAAGRVAGADDFLAKPFHAPDLLTKIGALLTLRWTKAQPVEASPRDTQSDHRLPSTVHANLRADLAEGDLEALRAALRAAEAAHPECRDQLHALKAAAAGFDLARLRELLA